jgi:hypothetical protein
MLPNRANALLYFSIAPARYALLLRSRPSRHFHMPSLSRFDATSSRVEKKSGFALIARRGALHPRSMEIRSATGGEKDHSWFSPKSTNDCSIPPST